MDMVIDEEVSAEQKSVEKPLCNEIGQTCDNQPPGTSTISDEQSSSQQKPVEKPLCNEIGKTCNNQPPGTSTISDEQLPSQQKPVEKPLCSEVEKTSDNQRPGTSTISDEQLPSQQKPLLSCIEQDSSSDETDNISADDEEESHPKKSQGQGAKLSMRRCYPIIWAGNLVLEKLQSKIEIKFISGDPNISKAALPLDDILNRTIHIRFVMLFKDVPQRHVIRKVMARKESCVLLALPINNSLTQATFMQDRFIHYFCRKRVIGVAEFPQDETVKSIYKMFFFPPSDFVRANLRKIAPKFVDILYSQSCYPHLWCFISRICYCPVCRAKKKT